MLLTSAYFQSYDTVAIAHDLIGKYLVREHDGLQLAYKICEVEAYHGAEDKACHARFGQTPRNQVLYQAGGVWYVYLCYGRHWLLNIVTGPANHPAAVLLRGAGNICGPARLTRHLAIDKQLNGQIALPESGLWIEDRGYIPTNIIATPRIGIDYAGEYRAKPWRFVLADKSKSG